jgi:hypothetical protein
VIFDFALWTALLSALFLSYLVFCHRSRWLRCPKN